MIPIDRLDHLVLTVTSVEATVAFYQRLFGMTVDKFGDNRTALRFGRQKINLHAADNPLTPGAAVVTVGSGDLCFITEAPMADVVATLNQQGIAIEAGPGPRTGALGPITSVYIRDPDNNLIEISTYDDVADA